MIPGSSAAGPPISESDDMPRSRVAPETKKFLPGLESLWKGSRGQISVDVTPSRAARGLLSPWLLSIALFSPVVALYAAYFIIAPAGVVATGFIQYDQPSYMADAQAYFASGHFAFTRSENSTSRWRVMAPISSVLPFSLI